MIIITIIIISAAGGASPPPSHPYAGRFETKKGEVYRGSGTNIDYQYSTRSRPLAGLHCSSLRSFLQVKKHLCRGANNEDLLVDYIILY